MTSLLPVLIVIGHMQVAEPVLVKRPQMEIEFTPRTPNQMMSFYEARGFPQAMRDVLHKQCFITVGITNTSQKKIWMDLKKWRFSVDGTPMKRQHRDYWKQRWQAMGIPLRYQSTFRWTLIPESLDYLPGEREGGNLVLPFVPGYFSLEAEFTTGEEGRGKPIHIRTDKLYCAEDPPAEPAGETTP